MNILIPYLLRIAPGMILTAAILILMKKRSPLLHLFVFIMLFLLTRDAMTPEKLWSFGTEGFFWMRFVPDPIVLCFIGLTSLIMVFVMNKLSPELKAVIIWKKGSTLSGLAAGLASSLLVVTPFILMQLSTPIAERGGTVPLHILPFVLFTALAGNLYEEILFRGYLQGWIEKNYNFGAVRSALTSGAFFGFGHLFLAYTVTDVGLPIIIFATWEGCIAGLVRSRWGVIPATLTHGLAVFIMAGGFI